MNTEELKSRITILRDWYGSYRVIIVYRGREYSCYSNNSLAYDRITGYAYDVPDKAVKDFYTYKGALQAFYDECKRANAL